MSIEAQSPIVAQESAIPPSPSSDSISYLCDAIQRLTDLIVQTTQSATSVRGNMFDVTDEIRVNVDAQFTSLHLAATKSLREMKVLLCQEIDSITGIEQSEH